MPHVLSLACFFILSLCFLSSFVFAWLTEPIFRGGTCLYTSNLCRIINMEVLAFWGKYSCERHMDEVN